MCRNQGFNSYKFSLTGNSYGLDQFSKLSVDKDIYAHIESQQIIGSNGELQYREYRSIKCAL